MDELQKQIENLTTYLGADSLTICYHAQCESWPNPAFYNINIHKDGLCSSGIGNTIKDAVRNSAIDLTLQQAKQELQP